ncbi:Mut7-C RNAse domain-containing protein [Psychromonas aquimarina]|uniref:Mut7-C RNAse domain-containing protein n=1 Tax=Psychromonas aquimarina TaxID=444919 RepID=UPI0006870744|nr:Mut7-C RNAse domain-containing protein [Psychromonas aquimarina]
MIDRIYSGPFCSVAPLRFVCDEMLQGAGQWLRAAGYDTLLPHRGDSDSTVIAMANHGERWLITRDRAIPECKEARPFTLLLLSNGLDANLQELSLLIELNWFYRPFSRCQKCNSELEIPSAKQCRLALPDNVLKHNNDFLYCPCCCKYYWEGGHVRRMSRTLRKLQSGRFS